MIKAIGRAQGGCVTHDDFTVPLDISLDDILAEDVCFVCMREPSSVQSLMTPLGQIHAVLHGLHGLVFLL